MKEGNEKSFPLFDQCIIIYLHFDIIEHNFVIEIKPYIQQGGQFLCMQESY